MAIYVTTDEDFRIAWPVVWGKILGPVITSGSLPYWWYVCVEYLEFALPVSDFHQEGIGGLVVGGCSLLVHGAVR